MVGYSLMRCERYDTYGWGLSGIILIGDGSDASGRIPGYSLVVRTYATLEIKAM